MNSNSTSKSLASLFSSFLNGLVFETFFVTTRIAATTLRRGGSDGYCDDNGKPRNLIFRNLGGTTKAVGAGHRQAGPCAIPIVTRQSVVERPSFSDPNFYSSRAGPCLVFHHWLGLTCHVFSHGIRTGTFQVLWNWRGIQTILNQSMWNFFNERYGEAMSMLVLLIVFFRFIRSHVCSCIFQLNGPFGWRGEERRVEGSRVKLVKN